MYKYTIRDVAREAGVSIATASRVINETQKVNESMEKKVHDAVNKLNYEINAVAKNLKEEKTNTVGVIIPDISNPYFMTISKGIEDVVHPNGYQLIFGSSQEEITKENELLNLFYGKRVEALVLASVGNNEKEIKKLHAQGTPIFLMDRRVSDPHKNYYLVEEDNMEGAYILTNELLRKGHRRIGVINGPLTISTGLDRFIGYKKAMEENGFEIEQELIFDGKFTQESGSEAVKYFLQGVCPSAILSFNNLMTSGALLELTKKNIRVPEQITVASYGIIEPAELFSYSFQLIYVELSPYEMGVRIGELLLEKLNDSINTTEYYHEKFKPILHV